MRFKAFAFARNSSNVFFRVSVVQHNLHPNLNFNLPVYFGRRCFISRDYLKLNQFEDDVRFKRLKFGELAEQFKSTIQGASKINPYDCSCYIYLMQEHELKSLPDILNRTESTTGSEEPDYIVTRVPTITALRKCHSLNCVDTAVEIYNNMSDPRLARSVLLMMDLLFENELYDRCLDIAMHEVESVSDRVIHSNWFYSTAIAAAYKLNTQEALIKAIKLFRVVNDIPNKPSYIDLVVKLLLNLVIYYSIKQNELNLALQLLSKAKVWNAATVNLKVLIYLSLGDATRAVIELQKYLTFLKKSDNMGDVNQYILFYDVFNKLKDHIVQNEDSPFNQKFLSFIQGRENFHTLITRDHLERYVTDIIQPKQSAGSPRVTDDNIEGHKIPKKRAFSEDLAVVGQSSEDVSEPSDAESSINSRGKTTSSEYSRDGVENGKEGSAV